jgi:hypothetical protein
MTKGTLRSLVVGAGCFLPIILTCSVLLLTMSGVAIGDDTAMVGIWVSTLTIPVLFAVTFEQLPKSWSSTAQALAAATLAVILWTAQVLLAIWMLSYGLRHLGLGP